MLFGESVNQHSMECMAVFIGTLIVVAPICLLVSFVYRVKYRQYENEYISCENKILTVHKRGKTYNIANVIKVVSKSKSYFITGDITVTTGRKVKQCKQRTLRVPKYFDNISYIVNNLKGGQCCER